MRLPLFCLTFSAVVSAQPVPQILDFYPECFTEPAETFEFKSKKIYSKEELINVEADPRFAAILSQLQTEAAAKNAQALTIEKILKKFSTGKTPGTLDEHRLQLTITARLFRYCPDNIRLSTKQPPYTAQGHKVILLANETAVPERHIILKKPVKDKVYKEPENYVVSLEGGVAGVLPGQTKSEILALFGSPSVKIQLQNAGELWGYGRKIWLKFDDKLQWISTESDLLSTAGLNNIDLVDAYDNSDWSIEGKVSLKSQLSELQQQLPSQFRPTDELQLIRQKDQHSLLLGYEHIKQYNAAQTEPVLTHFTLVKATKTQVKVPEYSSATLSDWLKQATQNPDLSVEKLKQQIPLHQFERGTTGSWIAAGNHLLLHYQNDNLSKVRIGESLFKQQSNPTEVKQLVVAAGFPITRAQFLARYPDAIDSGYELTVYEGSRSIVAGFSSEAENAPIESLELNLI